MKLYKLGETIVRTFLAALIIFCTQNVSAVTITFDDYEFTGVGWTSYFNPIDIGEYRFTPIDGNYSSALGIQQQDSDYYSGSAGIIGVNGSNIILTRIDGEAFSASSLEVDQVFVLGQPLELVGARAGGGSITQTFLADYTIGYQSLTLIGFDNITSLQLGAVGTYNANLANWDNIVLSAPVPIPAATWLFCSGLIGLIGVARRKKT